MKSTILACLVFLAVVLVVSQGVARTWRVNTAGTGDAPDLYAAMDSVAAYDVVLVEAGEYYLPEALTVKTSVRLVGESGPAYTLLYTDQGAWEPVTVSLLAGASISGIHVRGNTHPVMFFHEYSGADHCIVESIVNRVVVSGISGYPPLFENCLFIGGEIAVPAWYTACIIFSDLGSYAVGSTLFFNDVLGEVDPRIDASDFNGNFSLDPQFCGIPGSGNYFLRSTSPCLAENNPYWPHLVGPLPLGCGAVPARGSTWGAVKALYRER
jgi:hypothetical protein